jgi:hypothetical protein
MKGVLSREAANDVPLMLKMLQLSIEFEQQLDRKFLNTACIQFLDQNWKPNLIVNVY